MIRLMVQGDRDAKGIEDAVRALGAVCKERGIGLNVGESGEIVRILTENCPDVRVHIGSAKKPNIAEGAHPYHIDCLSPAYHVVDRLTRQSVDIKLEKAGWFVRLAALSTSDGFVFFPGREGTLAHLVPIMAFIAKGERDKGVARPRRVALLDWKGREVNALMDLFGISNDEITNTWPAVRSDLKPWLMIANTGGIRGALETVVNFLTDGLSAE